MFSIKKNSKMEDKHMRISILLQNCKRRSLTPSKISIIIFIKTIRRFMFTMRKVLNFHVFLKEIPKLKTNTCEFYFFSNLFGKMHKVKSNTFKNINYHIFQNNPQISVQNGQNTSFLFFFLKTPKLKTNKCEFLFLF